MGGLLDFLGLGLEFNAKALPIQIIVSSTLISFSHAPDRLLMFRQYGVTTDCSSAVREFEGFENVVLSHFEK